MKLRGGTQIQILIATGGAVVILVFGFAVAAAAFGTLQQGEPAPNTLGSVSCQGWTGELATYQQSLNTAAQNNGISPALLAAIFKNEHGSYDPSTKTWKSSSVGALGPFQIMPDTWTGEVRIMKKNYTIDDAQDFDKAADVSAHYLAAALKANLHLTDIINLKDQDVKGIAVYYNGGPGYYQKWRDSGYDDSKLDSRYVAYKDSVLKVYKDLLSNCTDGLSKGDQIGDKPDSTWTKNIQNWTVNKDLKRDPTAIVLHFSGQDANTKKAVMRDQAIENMTQYKSYVQLLIDTDGKVYQLLPLDQMVATGSGSASEFAIGVYLIGQNEAEITKNTNQYSSLITTIQYLQKTYHMQNVIGNLANLKADKGVFGHMQVQKDAPDPGSEYLKKVWGDLGLTVPKGAI